MENKKCDFFGWFSNTVYYIMKYISIICIPDKLLYSLPSGRNDSWWCTSKYTDTWYVAFMLYSLFWCYYQRKYLSLWCWKVKGHHLIVGGNAFSTYDLKDESRKCSWPPRTWWWHMYSDVSMLYLQRCQIFACYAVIEVL